jgi:hypothetical protein
MMPANNKAMSVPCCPPTILPNITNNTVSVPSKSSVFSWFIVSFTGALFSATKILPRNLANASRANSRFNGAARRG